ncbi:glycosyltransferase (plasmid) [Saprospira sp. CCB-QB6]|uniref:glycosyltransferase n=1 Tax=Saprospira sp. CCB-QB6 TaxID=3023936 RepID=UPI00234ACBBC|nr:glycosyltransferase [Saprospira sp. CCB-QB6]WCL83089.1 glycosyltransferase [Saprospira sp. CCB-QB6]
MSLSTFAPVVLFVYQRPDHLAQTLAALAENEEASQSPIYIYSDGPKADASPNDLADIAAVRQLIREQTWAKQLEIIEREENWGLRKNIVAGVTEVMEKHGRAIILENDIVASPYFLRYMNQALDLYQDVEEVMHISGFIYPLKLQEEDLGPSFFYNVNSCWGWASWQRAWKHYRDDTANILAQINKNYDPFSFNGGQKESFYKQLQQNLSGELNTWACHWHASIFLQNGLALHPYRALVKNIGLDGSGAHCDAIRLGQNMLKTPLSLTKVELQKAPKQHQAIAEKMKLYFKRLRWKELGQLIRKGAFKSIFQKIKAMQ